MTNLPLLKITWMLTGLEKMAYKNLSLAIIKNHACLNNTGADGKLTFLTIFFSVKILFKLQKTDSSGIRQACEAY